VVDALPNGRCMECMTIVDDFTKKVVDIVIDHGILGLYVVRVLDHVARFWGYTKALRTDQRLERWARGPEPMVCPRN